MASTITYQVSQRGGQTPGSLTLTVATEGEDYREVALPPGVTNKEIDLDFVHTALKSCLISCSGVPDNTTVTILTNSTGAPGDTLTFKAPAGLFYATDANGAAIGSNPFTADVTRLYAQHDNGSATGTLRIEIQTDPTP